MSDTFNRHIRRRAEGRRFTDIKVRSISTPPKTERERAIAEEELTLATAAIGAAAGEPEAKRLVERAKRRLVDLRGEQKNS